MNCPSPAWIAILSALLTPTIAVIAVYVAWQQWRTNRNKLKLELFEKRYAYYDAAGKLLGSIISSGRSTDQARYEFLVATKGARFIVGAPVADYFEKELYRKAIDLSALDSELEGLAGQDRTRNIERQREIKNWFGDQYRVLDKKFEPLMSLTH